MAKKVDMLNMSPFLNYFYNKNYIEFCSIKNKTNFYKYNIYKISKSHTNFNCLKGGVVLQEAIKTYDIYFYYEHGEIVAIKIQ